MHVCQRQPIWFFSRIHWTAFVSGENLTGVLSPSTEQYQQLHFMFRILTFVGARVGRIVGVRLTFTAIVIGLDLLTVTNLFVGETEGG